MQIRDLIFVALGGACVLSLGLFVLQWRWAAGKRTQAAKLLAEAKQKQAEAGRARSEGCMGRVLTLVLAAAVIVVFVITMYLLLVGPPSWLQGMPTPTPTQTPTASLLGLVPPRSYTHSPELLCGHGSVTAAGKAAVIVHLWPTMRAS
jgi:hypothetical protein